MAKKWQDVRAEAEVQGRLDEDKVAEAKRTMRDAERAAYIKESEHLSRDD